MMRKQKQRHLKDYELLQEIGRGTFSNVYKAERKADNSIIALKEIKRDISQKDLLLVQNEIDILKNVKGPNIIEFYGDFKENGKWYLGFQYCPNGDLNQLLKKEGVLHEETVQMISYCISSALFVLHNNNIVHRDLKLANILINKNSQIKLADFGFSRNSEEQLMQTYCGTPITMAPEILQRKAYSENCDTWSLGIITYQMLYGTPPFLPKDGKGFEDLAEMIIKKKLEFKEGVKVSEDGKCFLSKCLIKDPSKRPSLKEIMNDSWIMEGMKRLETENNIFQRYIPSQLNFSPKLHNYSSYDEKIELKQEVEAAFRYVIQQHYQTFLKKMSFNNIKSIYKKYSQILNEESLKFVPYLFLKRIRSLFSIEIKLNYLQKSVRIPLKQYEGYIKIQTQIVDFVKQLITQVKEEEVNLEKVISLNLYDSLIDLIQTPPSQQILYDRLQTFQSLIQLIDSTIGDGQVTIHVNQALEQTIKNSVIEHLNSIKEDEVVALLNKHSNSLVKKEEVSRLFRFDQKPCEKKQVGAEYEQLEFVKVILKRRAEKMTQV